MRVTACLFLAVMMVAFSIFSLNLMEKTVSGLNDNYIDDYIIVPKDYGSIQEAIKRVEGVKDIKIDVKNFVYAEQVKMALEQNK